MPKNLQKVASPKFDLTDCSLSHEKPVPQISVKYVHNYLQVCLKTDTQNKTSNEWQSSSRPICQPGAVRSMAVFLAS